MRVGPLGVRDSGEVRRIAEEHGCRVDEVVSGRLWWREITLVVAETPGFVLALAAWECDRLWWQAMR